jgi:amino acid adenylation domain-containing protein
MSQLPVTLANILRHPDQVRPSDRGRYLEPVPSDSRIPRRGTQSPCALSFAQETIWFWDRFEPQNPMYNVPFGLRIRGNLDVEALRKSLDFLVDRHETLRTTFVSAKDRLVQVIHRARAIELAVTDISRLAGDERHAEVKRLANAEVRRPFNLSRDLMLRAALFQLAPDDFVLVLTMHHIISDGWSLGVLLRDLSEAYTAYSTGHSPRLPELSIQYADYAMWQRKQVEGKALESLLSFWKERLADYPDFMHIRTDHPRPHRQTFAGARESLVLSKELELSLVRLSQRRGASLFMALLGAFQTLLNRYSAEDDIVVGFPMASRNQPETNDLIGFFANTVVFRSDLSGNPTFLDYLGRVRERAFPIYQHQDLPFAKLVESLAPERSASHTPFFQTLFVFESAPMPTLDWPGLTVSRFEVDTGTAKFDLSVLIEKKDGLEIAFEYNTDLFEAATIKRMLGHYRVLLEEVVKNPDRRLGQLPLLTEAERRQILFDWNQTQSPYPERSVHELFEEQAERTPDAPAILFKDQQLSYRELNTRSNALSMRLRSLGCTTGAKVAVLMERAPEVVIALLGILKAGGAYLPLDPADPAERLAFLLRDAGVGVLVTQARYAGTVDQSDLKVISLDRWKPTKEEAEAQNLAAETTVDSLAYVIYTSGSTGTPKGVEIPHRGIVRLLFGQDYARFGSNTVFLQFVPLWFDLSTFEIWGPLLHGGKCVLFPGRVGTAHELGEVIRKYKVTTLWLTASLYNAVIDEAPEELATVQQILIGGEALSVPHIRRGLEYLPQVELINGYGPTENTTLTSTYPIPREIPQEFASIPIGRPISNSTIYILDKNLQLVPVGVPGELYTGGAGLARGYLNRPTLTEEKFISNPFSESAGDPLYKTGDLARYLPDGNVEYLGRLDNQVKVRGFRIELGEIESALATHPDVKMVAVEARESCDGTKYLVAHVVRRQVHSTPAADLRTFLEEKLPAYMVPSQFVLHSSLPLLSSGKVNRRLLAEQGAGEPVPARRFLKPRDSIEARLVGIWESILDTRPVSVTDNFFDLGGHSLKAVRLFVMIEQAFGIRLDLSTLLTAPTVEELARCLRKPQASDSSSLSDVSAEEPAALTGGCGRSDTSSVNHLPQRTTR